jgi:predicted site-specific integrase-resolvase
MPTYPTAPASEDQVYLTVKKAAQRFGIPYWKLLRACNAGLIPTYRLLNSKRYVKIADIEATLQESVEVVNDSRF